MPRLYDHIDLRVRTLAEVRDFYEVLLPALGFMRETRIPNWLQYEAAALDDRQRLFSALPNRPATCLMRTGSRFGRKARRKSIASPGLPRAPAHKRSKVPDGKMKNTTAYLSKTRVATALRSATVGPWPKGVTNLQPDRLEFVKSRGSRKTERLSRGVFGSYFFE